MLPGVFQAKKANGTIYYRSNITYKNKHISLGSFDSEILAHKAYSDAQYLIDHPEISIDDFIHQELILSFEKGITIINYRDNNLYIANPIYLRKDYFSYFLSPHEELKFDIDDLFYYSSHKIIRRNNHLFTNDYGMQVTIQSRYGIKSYAIAGKDYVFINGDNLDYRYSNLDNINPYFGVSKTYRKNQVKYLVKIHINGNYKVGLYSTPEKAAIAYNKAVDLAKSHGVDKNYNTNYIESLSAKEYAEIYTNLKISSKYLNYLKGLAQS